MKQETLDLVAPLLSVLRQNPALREVRPATFHLDGRNFLHFHEEADGVVADVRLSAKFVRMPVSSPSEQADLLGRIDHCLASLDAHVRDRRRRGRQRRSQRDG